METIQFTEITLFPVNESSSLLQLSCKVDINSVFAEWKFSVKGHTLSGNIKETQAKAQLKETTALFEASAFPNRAVSLRTFYVEK